MHASLGLNNTNEVRNTRSLPYSDDNESLEHNVVNVLKRSKSGNPMQLHKPSYIWRRSPCLQSNLWLECQLSGAPSVQIAWRPSHVELNDAAMRPS